MVGSESRSLLVDLYELTMAAGYFHHRVRAVATFELFVRELPPERSFLVAAGIESALDYLASLRFTDSDVEFLRHQPAFRGVRSEFFEFLQEFRFTGKVLAAPEGTIVFAQEPIVQVTAPILEAQVVETYLLSVIHFETLIASKAARIVEAAGGRGVLEFGTRRAHGPEAGVRAARAAYIGGCTATSNVLAGRLYGVPLAGTAAHSWTLAFPSERESFQRLLEIFPETAVLLVDTYDSLQGTEAAASLGRKIPGVRLDSGDLASTSRQVRGILDRHGLQETKIVASGDLDEYKILALVDQGAPIDLFGVGTELATSRDAPALGVVYKLVAVDRNGRLEYKAKFSEGKFHYPGRKQVFRFLRDGLFAEDWVASADERVPEARALLEPRMQDGYRLGSRPASGELRSRALANLAELPARYKRLHQPDVYPVRKSARLESLLAKVKGR